MAYDLSTASRKEQPNAFSMLLTVASATLPSVLNKQSASNFASSFSNSEDAPNIYIFFSYFSSEWAP